jgi:sugar lactone lactonase YvrE
MNRTGRPHEIEPTTLDVSVVLRARAEIGESPVWSQRTQELYFVDIAGQAIHAYRPSDRRHRVFGLPDLVTSVSLRERGGLVLSLRKTLAFYEPETDHLELLADPEPDRPGNRFNDARCDPQGRLWAGTMSKTRAPGAAALFRLDPGREIERVIAGTTVSNGLAWSPSGDRMYFIDSTTQRIDVFDFDGRTGEIAGRRPFAEIDPADGLPDGMTVDAEGGIWVCLFGGAAIRRYDPDGALSASIPVPTTNPTSPAFGGPDLRTLYVTTARHRLTAAQLAREPLAGAVLSLDPGVEGLPGNRFAG